MIAPREWVCYHFATQLHDTRWDGLIRQRGCGRGLSLKILTKRYVTERAGIAAAELQNRCSTTELTRHFNDLAILHSTNWHRIGTGRLGQDCSYQLRRQAINDRRT
jgi:hypothetical protein